MGVGEGSQRSPIFGHKKSKPLLKCIKKVKYDLKMKEEEELLFLREKMPNVRGFLGRFGKNWVASLRIYLCA